MIHCQILLGSKQKPQWNLTKKEGEKNLESKIKTIHDNKTTEYLAVMILRIYGLFHKYGAYLANS